MQDHPQRIYLGVAPLDLFLSNLAKDGTVIFKDVFKNPITTWLVALSFKMWVSWYYQLWSRNLQSVISFSLSLSLPSLDMLGVSISFTAIEKELRAISVLMAETHGCLPSRRRSGPWFAKRNNLRHQPLWPPTWIWFETFPLGLAFFETIHMSCFTLLCL